MNTFSTLLFGLQVDCHVPTGAEALDGGHRDTLRPEKLSGGFRERS
jgi:hypothetical protein